MTGQGHPELACGVGDWDCDVYGNHRILVRVAEHGPAVLADVPWRRRDPDPEQVDVVLLAPSGRLVRNSVTVEASAEHGLIVFEPVEGPGTYAVHYLPYAHTGKPYYPQAAYRRPTHTADPQWVHDHGLDRPDQPRSGLPRAEAFRYEAASAVDSFAPLGFVATRAERAALEPACPDAEFLLFGEDRAHPLGRYADLPARWARGVPFAPFAGVAQRGEHYAFQVGVYARTALADVRVDVRGLPFAVRCVSRGGTDARGRAFERRIDVDAGGVCALWLLADVPAGLTPGLYEGEVAVSAEGTAERVLPVQLTVGEGLLSDGGVGEPERLARLAWLDSTAGHDDALAPPFTPVTAEATGDGGHRLGILGRAVHLGPDGLPHRLVSTFTPAVTAADGPAHEVLAAPVRLDLGRAVKHDAVTVQRPGPARVTWSTRAAGDGVLLCTEGELEADGFLVVRATVEAAEDVELPDVRLEVPVHEDVARYTMGLGLTGRVCPDTYDWTWDTPVHNQDSLWLGTTHAGVQLSLRDEHYDRPLNTNYYREKPLVTPGSWAGDEGLGGVRLRTADGVRTVTAHSGRIRLRAGESRCFELRLLLTPFKPIDPRRQLAERYFHAYATPQEVADYGANVVNLHHATPPNPYINDPLLAADVLRAYTEQAHARGVRVKVYDTVRELTRHTPELPVLASFGDEVLAAGPGGGHAWLQEHLGGDFVPGWVAPNVRDVAVVTTGESRWHNFYVQGIRRLREHLGVDGLYLDDVAYDRATMKRVRKALTASGDTPALVDLHSCNQYRAADGFASSANLYAELLPYVDRLWLGELFDYDGTDPAYWLVELSGIPFGLMGEMLEGGGNPWRGLVFGMTARAPMTDVRPLWRAFDRLGLPEAEMTGWWAGEASVATGHDEVLATTWRGADGRTTVALASWAAGPAECSLSLDGRAVTAHAPAIDGFQDAGTYPAGSPVPVAPGRGLLLRIEAVEGLEGLEGVTSP
ncbi:glycoside hydrolase domain-containing protein [Streptomyces sp. NPDC050085]|uniref:glycoside hydrolase domain-containing protein n=1 Tax=Streptomyces sp. NPDC050085 TaxID=3365600 RepID=UPI003789E037